MLGRWLYKADNALSEGGSRAAATVVNKEQ